MMQYFYILDILLHLKHQGPVWCDGYKFHVKNLDDMKKTCGSGITIVFEVTNTSFRNNIHPQESQNQYYDILDYILECDFNTFKMVLFIVKWYKL